MKRGSFPSLNALLVIYLLMILILSGALTGTSYFLLFFFGVIPGLLLSQIATPLTVIIMVILFAMMISLQFGRSRLRPVNDLINAMGHVSRGDFSARVDDRNIPMGMENLVRSFNNMVTDLGSIELFRKDFINNFSHEFKTPIVSIRGFAKQLARDDLTDEQRREYAAIIISESERLANMSTNILLLTKLENQQIVTDQTEYRLDEQLRSCVLLLEKQWSAKNIELALELEPACFYGNEEMCSHIWLNLLGNAVKFSPEGGLMEIRLTVQDDRVTVTIRDQGPGMDEATRKRIFEKFYQGDSAHATEGNGLGLSLVKRIVDLCNGTVCVDSRPGEGAAFTVTLPRST